MAFMNFLAFVSLLLLSVNAQHDVDVIASQLHVTPIEGQTPNIASQIPVFLARDLLNDLKLFNLIGEVVQARLVNSEKELVFQMSNPVQAEQVVKAWSAQPGELTKTMKVHHAKERLL